ncbi:kinase [Sphingomonas bacterium]|uniref:kinase n=1 Tax=Sphingomonas bacterium TaxID=1895847 RepID=UPI00157698AA|nr:kinase [Sphingomonas bacterium]
MSPDVVAILETAVLDRLRQAPARPLVLGLCGAQGSGKSTASAVLAERLTARSLTAVTLSLDDLYLTREERMQLADSVHPLLATRGVPGTHDVALGHAVLDALSDGGPTALPRFDKARDTRVERSSWERVEGRVDVVIFEGWCIGAMPETVTELATPVNALERGADADGRWRRWVNARLASDYQRLFRRIDLLALLAAPSFAVVAGWRTQQEHDLRARTGDGMDDATVATFVQHYQRLTEHILREMPGRADLLVQLDTARAPLSSLARVA